MPPTNEFENYESALSLSSLLSLLMAITLGILAAVVFAPSWIPSFASSLLGSAPQAYWYLSRASAFAALGLLWLSTALGLLITNKMSKTWPGAPAAFAIHEYVSLLGLAFAGFHALILVGDRYINYQVAQLLLPFGSVNYRPLWVGIGQLGFYLWAIVNASFYVRRLIGPKSWRLIHYASFLMFLMAIGHGLLSGTDTTASWAQAVYWSLGGSVLFLTVYRILASAAPRPAGRVHPAAEVPTTALVQPAPVKPDPAAAD